MRDEIRRLVREASFEVFPEAGIVERVRAVLPVGTQLSITVSPRGGIEPTLAMSEQFREIGYPVTPHLAARMIRDEHEVRRIAARLHAARVDRVFTIAGDAGQAGSYSGAVELLRELRSVPGAPVAYGIAGYPEGHPFLSPDEELRQLSVKASLASWIVTQMSFDAEALGSWAARMHTMGIELPIVLGVPGAVRIDRLAKLGLRAGIGSASRVLREQAGVMSRIVRGRWAPGRFITEIIDAWPEALPKPAGLHICTFNDVERTARRLGIH